MKSLLVGLVRLYQWGISPMMGPTCRFYPTCSNYAVEALHTHGALKGFWLALVRVSKCHPWNGGGFDPVPPVASTDLSQSHLHAPGCGCKHS
ncbi:MAG: membrane protein insertion efficiency factor YidD [Burkholderiaceae bacterium]|nr:membrane protein insertion efficiency factor YidD [Burkholderiaceae bacterium]